MQRFFACAGLGALVTIGGPALAHAYLSRAVPAAGSTVAASPDEVDCTFTEALEQRFSMLEVRDAAGQRVDAGPMRLSPRAPKQMIIGVGHLGAGTYTVTWRAVSVDTHRTEGSFSFTVAP
jgi:methionine-rich copper-binding protein CopC